MRDFIIMGVVLWLLNILLIAIGSVITKFTANCKWLRWIVINKKPEHKIAIQFPLYHINEEKTDDEVKYTIDYHVYVSELRGFYMFTWYGVFLPFFIQFFIYQWVYENEHYMSTYKEFDSADDIKSLSEEEVLAICHDDYAEFLIRMDAKKDRDVLREERRDRLNKSFDEITNNYRVMTD